MTTPVNVAHVLMVCPAALREAAAYVASQLSRNPADNTPMFFPRPLENAETGEVTHYLGTPMVTALTLSKLPELEAAFPGAAWTKLRDADSRERLVNVEAWLASLGLRFVPDPPEEL